VRNDFVRRRVVVGVDFFLSSSDAKNIISNSCSDKIQSTDFRS
jgi:hypothetical protein